jgi:hypothetical protein
MDDAQVEFLASLVQANPVLYEVHHEDHKDQPLIRRIWMTIAETMGMEPEKRKSASVYCILLFLV